MPATLPDSSSGEVRYARVLLREPVGLLDYRIPVDLLPELAVGAPVRVPLGRRETTGFVAEIVATTELKPEEIKLVASTDTAEPALPANVLSLIRFAADYYRVPAGEILAAALPRGRYSLSDRYRLTAEAETARHDKVRPKDLALLSIAHKFPQGFSVSAAVRELGWSRRATLSRIKALTEKGWLQLRSAHRQSLVDLTYVRTRADPTVLGKRRQASLRLWQSLPDGMPFLAATVAANDPQALRKLAVLERAGLVCRVDAAPGSARPDNWRVDTEAPVPTAEQQQAIDAIFRAIDDHIFRSFLLAGVTGSGKTEVYLRIIEHALALGRTALVLVPEISLTPQLAARFRGRFGDRVAVFHSSLSPTDRRQQWERIARREAWVGLGARSALFLPLIDLGVVVVDEEHEGSFKQDESPRYHARDLAVVRAQQDKAVVVLGSATPSLESWTNAAAGRYQPLRLTRRVLDRPMPTVECLDLGREERVADGALTTRLAYKLEKTLTSGEQAILFLNRRGFAPYVYCRDCGHSHRCPDCAVGLTLHQRRQELLCHYCGYTEPAPDTCPKCSSHRLEASGLGTERLETQVRELFGDVSIGRLDRDSIRNKNDLERVLNDFSAQKTKLLIGTQMVTKGHDFPGVTLVGVINADASLNFPDFRAAERTFQLLSQVAGRAGRGDRPGLVIIQAYEPKHYAITAAAAHDYERFVAAETPIRRELGYPPFSFLALIRFEGLEEKTVAEHATGLVRGLQATADQYHVDLLGPAPAPLTRLKGIWRYQILLRAEKRKALHEVLARLPNSGTSTVRRILDVDPINML